MNIAAFIALALVSVATAQTAPDTRLDEARKKMAAGDAEGALAAIAAVTEKNPDLAPASLLFAGLLFQNGQMAAGRTVMERAAVESPDHPEVYSSFGRLALAEGRLLDASLCFERAASLATANRWHASLRRNWLNSAHAGSAAVAERRKDWKNAYASLLVLADLNPGDAVTRWRLGRASFFIDKPDQAEELFRSARKGNPNLELPELTLADLWMQKHDQAKAEKLLATAVAQNDSDLRARNAMTRFLIQTGRGEAARQSASKGLAMQPKDPEAKLLAVLASRQVGDVAAAEAVLTAWLAESPDDPVALGQSAQVNALSKDQAKKNLALERANAAAKLQSGRGDSQTTLGAVQFLLGNVSEAEKLLRSALLSGDANADTAFYLGMILEQKGDKEGAVRQYNRALEAPGLFLFRSEVEGRRDKLKTAAPAQTKP